MDQRLKDLGIPHNTGVKGVRREAVRFVAMRDMRKAKLNVRVIDLEKNILLTTKGMLPNESIEWF